MSRSVTRLAARARWVAALVLALVATAPAFAVLVGGTVFEDVNYGGGAGRTRAAASGVARPNARVELYNVAGNFVSATTTDASGNYSFNVVAGSYTIRVVNGTVTSSRPGAVGTLVPVQTFRTNASSGSAVGVTDRVGGEVPSKVDAGNGSTTLAALTTAATTAQSITAVTFLVNIGGLDFGFNFNTIVNVNDSGQGSLRQFVINGNTLGNGGLAIQGQTPGKDVSIFMISDGLAHPGLRAGLANLLSGGGVAVIGPATALPPVTGADTTLDGTTQTANVGNTNAVVLGIGGTVGVDTLAFNQVAGPEVEIRDGAALAIGIQIQANDATVRGFAILGFGAADGEAGIVVDDTFTGALIESNVLGSPATSFTDPGAGLHDFAGVYSAGADNGTIQNNVIGFCGKTGVYLINGSSGWTVAGNEIRDVGTETTDGDGITINGSASNSCVGNFITGSSSQGIVVTAAGTTGNSFTNNTVTGNGVGTTSAVAQSAGITLRSTAGTSLFDRNVIRANYGAGLAVNNGATAIRLTRNSFLDNGTITSRSGGAATGQIGIDLNNTTDNADLGTAPFPTINDNGDGDAGGNGLLNFPIVSTAQISAGSLILNGFARPGSVIELFVVAADPSGFGEGQTWKQTLTEGGTGAGGDDPYADTDNGTGTYGPGAINGVAQGTDTTNRFRFTFPLPPGIAAGNTLTATATVGGGTSEFGGNVTVTSPPGGVSGRVFEDANFAGTAANYDGGVADLGLPGVDVELYDAGTNAYIAGATTAAGGTYSFAGLVAGNYKVRVRAATVGDADTPPRGGLNATVPATWPYPLAEMTWGNASALYGGQSATVDDTATADNAGPGDDFVTVAVAAAVVANVNFGFAYNLIVNADDDSNAAATRSKQGTLRQFLKNADAISALGGTTANTSQFRMQVAPNQSSGGDSWWRITTPIALPPIADGGTVLDGTTQAANGANTNTLGPEIEIVGTGTINGVNIVSAGNTVRGLVASGYDGFLDFAGIAINGAAATGNTVAGNYLGTNATGTAAAATRNYQGVAINGASSNTIGGITAADRNVISGNVWNGVRIRYAGATTNTIAGNYIGTNAAGTAAVPNQLGVYVWDVPNNLIGGTSASAANVLSGNTQVGVHVFGAAATGNAIQGNGIGLDAARAFAVPNAYAGVQFSGSSNNLLGGTAPGAGNVIAGNGTYGVLVNGAAPAGNAVVSNSIRANTGLGIDLGADGITPNDAGDVDAGANGLLNFPVVTSAKALGGTIAAGFALDVPAGSYRVEFFKNPSGADPSGNGEGEVFASATTIAHPGGGSQPFTHTFAGAAGDVLSATATVCSDGAPCTIFGDTSEFSGVATASTSSIVKRGFLLDGTPLPDGVVVPRGTRMAFLLYVNNPGSAIADVSLADALDPGFAYLPASIRAGNTVAACAAAACTPIEEAAIFAAGTAAPAGSDAIDLDTVSYSGGAVRAGNQAVANAQLDIAGAKVFALVFTVRVL